MRSREKPRATTLHPRMATITGLLRIAPIQSKFSNMTLSLGGLVPGGVPALRGGQLRDAVRRRRDQLAVLRVLDDVAIGDERARVLATRFVERRQAGERREAERLAQLGA